MQTKSPAAAQFEIEVKPSAIFIHALFRTGSTYIWNKFRQLPRYVCYYEPFHQLLGGVTPDTVKNSLTLDYKAAGHPEIDKYYFYEYEKFLREGTPGVPFFRKEISFDWFCLSAGETNPYQKRYVDFLIRGAGNKIPLFQFNRTALRSGWFKSFYPGSRNVYLYRDPRDQWQSYRAIEARTGFDKFFVMDLIALSKNRENTFIRPLAQAIPLLKFHSAIYADEELFYRNLCQAYGEKEKYFVFYYLWLLSLLENALHADMLWDINALASDEAYRQKIQQELVDWNIDPIDFNDCHITRYSDLQLAPDTMAEIEAGVRELIVDLYAKDQLEKIVRLLPPVTRDIFERLGKRSAIQPMKRPADELQVDWLKTAEKLTAWIMDDRLQKEKDADDLRRELKNKDEQLLRSSGLLAHEVQKVEKQGQEISTLTVVLAEKEGLIGRLQDDLEKKKQEAATLASLLVKKEESIGLLQGDLEKKKQEAATLASSLVKKEESIGLLQGDLEKKKQEIAALASSLVKKEDSLGLLQGDLEKKKQEIAAKTGSLVEKSESIALLQAKFNILFHSYSFRIGKIVIFPLHIAKKIFLRLKGISLPSGLSRDVRTGLVAVAAEEKKISVAEQIQLDFGRHRSGLKYGLQYLLGLHHPRGVDLDAFIERTFSWHPERNLFHSQPWIGFIHVPPCMPEWFQPAVSNAAIFRSEAWQKSLPHCRGLFTFSRYHLESLQKLLPLPLAVLRLPSETPALTWSWEAFESNREKKLVQVGWWLRRLHAIFQFPRTPFQKVFLDVGHPSLPQLLEKEREILIRQGSFQGVDMDSVTTVPYLANGEYDRLLSRNIVFMFLYDSSACNAIVECMVRRTPLLINPLAAVVEYLGEDYPFYFESLEEAAAKLMNPDLIHRTHEYLCRLPRVQELDGECFLRAFNASGIYQSLAAPR